MRTVLLSTPESKAVVAAMLRATSHAWEFSRAAAGKGTRPAHLAAVRRFGTADRSRGAWIIRHPDLVPPGQPCMHGPYPYNAERGKLAGLTPEEDSAYVKAFCEETERLAARPRNTAPAELASLEVLAGELCMVRSDHAAGDIPDTEALSWTTSRTLAIEAYGPAAALTLYRANSPEDTDQQPPELAEAERKWLAACRAADEAAEAAGVAYSPDPPPPAGCNAARWKWLADYEAAEDARTGPGPDGLWQDDDGPDREPPELPPCPVGGGSTTPPAPVGTGQVAEPAEATGPGPEPARAGTPMRRSGGSLAGAVRQARADTGDLPRVDPGPFPSRLLSMPGFVDGLKAVSMAGAPYPNETAAFAGALAALSFLTGRKIRTVGDARTNLFILLLAASGSGKDYPRKVNAALLKELFLVPALGDSFASAEGLEDALVSSPSMLYQSDEISEYFASVAADKEGRWRNIQAIMMRLYSSANSVFSLRRKAGQKGESYVDQPHFVLFGTAVPSVCYAAVSEPMLTGGFLSRCIILEAGPRGTGQPPRAVEIPAALLEVARYWSGYYPGGDLGMATAQPATVPATEDAVRALADFRRFADGRYDAAEAAGDDVLRAVWSRAQEHTHKLALLYAASENHKAPTITESAVAWARDFVLHHTRRVLWIGKSCIADSPYQKESQRVLGILRRAGGELLRSELLKRSKLGVRDFDGIMKTLIETGQVRDALREHTGGRPGLVYTIGEA